ncbi:hypothetical protein BLA24064_06199 [Burkholderia latens]|uniref:Uncharacterized protein n=1 Tax=Burkholderia latens TaxID=488446 RepID=A0A6P2R6D2_9BURK|nr:hypothetical protein BLA24064_06199 [Burkholderia latens]
MSFSVSSSARLTPTAIAGRASGTTTRQNVAMRAAPSVRAASSRLADCVTNIARVLRYTYGYSTKPSTKIAPGSERRSGRRNWRGPSKPSSQRIAPCTGPIGWSRSRYANATI